MKILKHIIGVVLLFGLVLASPYIVEKLNAPRPPQQEKAEAPEPPEPKAPEIEGMPPQPSAPPVNQIVEQTSPRQGSINISGGGGGDTVVVGGAPTVNDKIPLGRISMGRGRDTLLVDGAGWLALDGASTNGMEVFKFDNKAANAVHVYEQGLMTADSNAIVIYGDPDIDTVTLDPAMIWAKPTSDPNMFFYEGTSGSGTKYSVSVSAGVKVIVPEGNK